MPSGPEWLERLPRLADECAEQWGLSSDRLTGRHVSLVLPAGDVVLKICAPDEETEHEPDALRVWAGDGAIRLLDRDAERHAMLLERCQPGTTLLEVDDDAAGDVVAGLLPRLWKKPPDHFRWLADVADRWLDELPGRWEATGRPSSGRCSKLPSACCAS